MSSPKLNINTSLFKLDAEQMVGKGYSGSSSPISIEKVTKEFNKLERINLSDDSHRRAIDELFPSSLLHARNDADWKLFSSMSRYDRCNRSFVAGCFNNEILELKLISYKWRRKDGIKWKTRAGTSPNGTPFIRIFTDDSSIYVIEGHRDCLTAILLGLNFVMIPYAGFRLKDADALKKEVSGRKVVFIVEDIAAFNCMSRIASAIEATASEIIMIQLKTGEKCDLSDYVFIKNNIKEVLDGLKNKELN